MIIYRRAQAADAATIRRLVCGAGLDPTSLRWEHFMLAVDDDTQRIMGCAQIKRHADCNEFGSLVVRKAARGHGVGAALLQSVVLAEPAPVHLICLSRMRAYYERFGFIEITLAASPRTLRIKQRAGRLFGVPVICMLYARSMPDRAAGS